MSVGDIVAEGLKVHELARDHADREQMIVTARRRSPRPREPAPLPARISGANASASPRAGARAEAAPHRADDRPRRSTFGAGADCRPAARPALRHKLAYLFIATTCGWCARSPTRSWSCATASGRAGHRGSHLPRRRARLPQGADGRRLPARGGRVRRGAAVAMALLIIMPGEMPSRRAELVKLAPEMDVRVLARRRAAFEEIESWCRGARRWGSCGAFRR